MALRQLGNAALQHPGALRQALACAPQVLATDFVLHSRLWTPSLCRASVAVERLVPVANRGLATERAAVSQEQPSAAEASGSQQRTAGGAGSGDTSASGGRSGTTAEADSSSGGGSGGSGDASSSGSGFDAGRMFRGFSEGVRLRFARGGGADGADGAAPPLAERAAKAWSAVVRDVRDAVLPQDAAASPTRLYEGPTYQAGPEGTYDGPTALAALPAAPKGRVQQLLEDMRSRFGAHPLFARLASVRLTSTPLAKKASDLADDIRDRYETSDHPMVHKAEEVKERLFGMSDAAAAMQEILSRDSTFDMAALLAGVKADARPVVSAFLTHDLATLRKHCGPELMERFSGIFGHFQTQGLVEDPTILFVGDVELVELRLADGDPLVVVQFNCQQIKCTRDKFGNVVDGSPSSIQKVFYFWGLQQEKTGTVLPDGRVLPPRWVIKDMMWQALMALV